MSDATAPRENLEVPSAKESKFRGYVSSRYDLMHVRLVVGSFGALALYAPYSWYMTAVAVVVVCMAEALDTISLNQSLKRLDNGGALAPELKFSQFTAVFQALLFASVVFGAAIMQPNETIDMFVICYLYAATMNAGLGLYYNPPAIFIRLLVYGITLILILSYRWMHFNGSTLLAYETFGALLLAYVAYRLIAFINDTFQQQEEDRTAADLAQTSLRRANQQLVNNEKYLQQLAAVAENANDAVIVFDKTGRITWVNNAFSRLTGYSLDDVMGRRPNSLLHGPLTSSETVAKIDNAAATHTPLRIEIQNYTKSGDPIWVETNLVPLPNTAQNAGGMIAIERNITHSKARETQLAEAMLKAERSERAKTEFLATTSHEIRTPMNSIVGIADLLAEQELDDQSKEYVTALQDTAQSLVRIVNDILDLSKLEAGKLKITPNVFELHEFFGKLDGLLRPRAEAKGLSFSIDLPEELPLIYADEGRIRQILVNVIDNAIKFTRSGGVTVSVQGSRIANTCRFAVDVTDSGIGISDDGMRRLFGYYAQAEDTTSQEYGGTGLGLAISRQLAREMGGDLTVVSHEGQGSCFSLFLPVPCATRRIVEETPAAQAPAPAPQDLSGRTVLVAEDNATNRMLMSKFLEKCGAEILFAEDGQQAITITEARSPDLILMDMQMPGVDGLEATRHIRAMDLAAQPYIIALTANAQKDDRDNCIAAGMDDFLTKPVRKVQLLETLQQVLATPADLEKPLS